jgi:4-amino-4-deoxy-L-arabinose transferase-like glycosyltransferase
MKLSKTEHLLISFIIVGAVLRFWNIGFQHTNWDEQYTLTIAQPTISAMQVIITSLTQDYTPPLYYLAAHYSMVLFGQNQTAIRIPSAIFGVLLIPIMFFVGKEYRDELFGLIAAGFTTIFYNAFFYSRYGRSYSMVLMFFSVAFYYFMRLIRGDKRASIPFGIFAVLSIWTHLYSAIPIGIMCLYIIWNQRSAVGVAITALGAIPLPYFYIPLIMSTRSQGAYNLILNGPNNFGATPFEVLYLTPLDIFAYSAFLIFPIVVWSVWRHRDDQIIQAVAIISVCTWLSMAVLSFKTPIIVHYAIPLVPMLLLPLILPFWEAIRDKTLNVWHFYSTMAILILEGVQIVALNTIQRGGSL